MKFTSTRAGGGKPRFKQHDRAEHGRRLSDEFEQALPPEEEEDAIVRVEFESEPGFDLQLQSLDSTRKNGFELLSVRVDSDVGRGDTTIATAQIPRAKLKHFRKIFEEYIFQNTRRGSPKHQVLVESIAKIRRAGLRSIWTDVIDEFPVTNDPIWWEVWLRRSNPGVDEFREAARRFGIELNEKQIEFIDRIAVVVFGTVDQLGALLEEIDQVAEVRRAKVPATEFLELAPSQQAELANQLAKRITRPPPGSPAVCVLDTGVNNGHVLLKPAIPTANVLTCNPGWGTDDHEGHGTEMAGLALYGDLTRLLATNGPVRLTHGVESVKILPRTGANKPEVYGALTQEAVARAEVQSPERARAVCMAITTTDNRDRGQPSSWSSAIDQLTSGANDGVHRLMCVSAGNADAGQMNNYPNSNFTDGIHDPGQAWNAVTVGAMADRVQITEPDFQGWSAIAQVADLSPSSTTSMNWGKGWPIKPEIVMPAGNVAIDPSRSRTDFPESLSLLTTYYQPLMRQFAASGETSAAAALAARLAARIQAGYPGLWPETIRGLLIHSATWTPQMMNRVASKTDRLRVFGYGVPDPVVAIGSADNCATLIAQQTIQPFEERVTRTKGVAKARSYVSREMHLHALPWPTDVLESLGEAQIELQVTLSYFIEPSPARRGFKKGHRYASHGLRFEIQTATESALEFQVRINKAARQENEEPSTTSDAAEWELGPNLRTLGSVHSDIWRGAAVKLARRSHVAVYPSIGWWKERHHLGLWSKKTRYALLVSIRAPEIDADIYTPIAAQIGIPVTVS
jgi:hypothetical protein